MIIVRLQGGLGNQLFQYATSRRLAYARNADLVIDTSWFNTNHRNVTPRKYELLRYHINARVLSEEEIFCRPLFTNRILQRLPLPRPLALVREKRFCFDPKVLALQDGTYLVGYWQSAKYFEDIRDILLEELRPRESMSVLDAAVAKKIAETTSVSIHVRRGDYVSLPSAAQVHGVCPIDYYQSAVSSLQDRVRDPTFFVFSDDPDWTKDNLRFDSPTVYVTHNGSDRAFQDLRLMSLCAHHIIANSSFSWWGAWLCENREQIVFAPAKWFTNGHNDTKDLFPDGWNML